MTVERILREPLRSERLGDATRVRVNQLLELVGLPGTTREKYPHHLSGGEQQRVAIARALARNPRVLVCDEAVSGLDVSVQAQILKLLDMLRGELGVTCVFISHDLSVVRLISDRVAVMYFGRLVELAAAWDLFGRTRHPYSAALLSAVPIPDPKVERTRERIVLPGAGSPPTHGCRFHVRCHVARTECAETDPILMGRGDDRSHLTACLFPLEEAHGVTVPRVAPRGEPSIQGHEER